MRIVSACGALALMVELIFIIQLSAASILSFLDEIKKPNLDMISTSPFPPNFLFGTASSSYQFEGAYLSDGKGLSNWDIHSHIPGKIVDGSNGDVAVDQYRRYLEDVNLMESLGVNSYRLSISWARILPKGRFGDVNLGGINYYNSLINALLLKGIQPFVTLTHFDLPQELEDRYGGWLSPESQEDFGYYADICFKYFGDRVKYWATFNEPNIQVIYGYRKGIFPPSRCSTPFGNCTHGNSEKEPFLAAHNIILSHSTAVDIYRTKYQREQGGSIGFVMSCVWYEPISNSTQDELASERALAFNTYWFLDPVILGRYPAEMTNILGSALPRFSSNEEEKLKKGLDFIGINHYTSFYTKDCIFSRCIPGREGTSRTEGLFEATPIGEPGEVEWLSIHPQGMEKTVTSIKERYNNIPMFITENGYGVDESAKPTLEKSLQDVGKVKYMSGHLDALVAALRKGADVRGYFAWSLLDNFEWVYGYTVRFGLHYVDYATQKRTPKLSAAWYKEFIASYNVSKSNVRNNIRFERKCIQDIRSS